GNPFHGRHGTVRCPVRQVGRGRFQVVDRELPYRVVGAAEETVVRRKHLGRITPQLGVVLDLATGEEQERAEGARVLVQTIEEVLGRQRSSIGRVLGCQVECACEHYNERCDGGGMYLPHRSCRPTLRASVKKRIASLPPSRPRPDWPVPPNGVRRSRISQVLIQTMPTCSCAPKRCARSRSRVQTDADNP